jgi:serine/threonine-protein kinase
MDYVAGEPLSRFLARRATTATPLPPAVASAIVGDCLAGLHAAHEARGLAGEPLGIVHRDVSPQNILVGVDGAARVIDFGIAKAAGRLETTRTGCVKGKIPYMAPEQLRGEPVSRRSDVYAAAVVLWECLTGRRLMPEDDHAAIEKSLYGVLDPPSRWSVGLPRAVDEVVMRGLARTPPRRFATAQEMADALEAALPRASALEVARWVATRVSDRVAMRAAKVAQIERTPLAGSAESPETSGPVAIDPAVSDVRTVNARPAPLPRPRLARATLLLATLACLFASASLALAIVVAFRFL